MDNISTQKFADKSQTYELVQTFDRSQEIAQQIIEASRNGEAVIGVDCEGILRGRPLCLIQVSLWFKFLRLLTNIIDFLRRLHIRV